VERMGDESEFLYANLGDIFLKKDEYEKALNYYEKAIALTDDNIKKSQLLNDVGLAYLRKGLTDEAIKSLKRAVILNPENKNAVFNLGVIYVRTGLDEKVKEDYKEFLKYDSGIDILYDLSKSIADISKQELLGGINIDFVGESEEIKKIKELIVKASATDSTVFIQGEHGTGKELVARAIHQLSKRADKPFIVINCSALPESLLESELFGYERGAFTGAYKEKPGRFELADKGTVFIDEIGDISQTVQVKLLRFIQEREFERVGGVETKKVDVRIITATNKDIKKLIKEGKFREDLFYRLYVFPIIMPPLRERGNDIILLAKYFLDKFSQKYNKNFREISDEAKRIFLSYRWLGNVRELENVIERIVNLYNDFEVKEEHIPNEIKGDLNIDSGKYRKNDNEKEKILNILREVNFSKTRAAEKLGISRVALWKKMKKYKIS